MAALAAKYGMGGVCVPALLAGFEVVGVGGDQILLLGAAQQDDDEDRDNSEDDPAGEHLAQLV